MLPLLLAQAEVSASGWQVVTALSALAALGVSAVTFVRAVGGKAQERQIEPTQLAAMQTELKAQTGMLSTINREVGEVRATVEIVKTDVAGFHQRVGGISRELAATTARVEGLERRTERS